MLSYGVYTTILFSFIFMIILIGTIVLFKLPLRQFVTLLESVFHFKQVRNIGDNYIIIDVCDDIFEVSKAMFSRLPFVFALGICLLVVILVFIDGCIFSTRHVYSNKTCSDRLPNCFLFKSRFTSFKPLYEFICKSNERVVPSNMSASYAVCYGFVLPDQSTIDVLNQLGICTGILSLVEFLYPLAYRFGREKYGRICLILILCTLVIGEIIILGMQLNVSTVSIILTTLTEALLLNIFFLHYRKVQYPTNLDRVGSYIELKDLN